VNLTQIRSAVPETFDSQTNKKQTRAKDVLPNINLTQAPEITPGRDGMMPSAADARCLQPAHTIRTLPGVTRAFFVPGDLDL